ARAFSVMPTRGAGIHVLFSSRKKRRGWPSRTSSSKDLPDRQCSTGAAEIAGHAGRYKSEEVLDFKPATRCVPSRRMIANIAPDDALILPHHTNPAGLSFSGTTGIYFCHR